MKIKVLWIDEELESEEYKEYARKLDSIATLNVSLFTKVVQAFVDLKNIEFEETIVIVSYKLYQEFINKLKKKYY